ncbi:MAG: IS66 family transposase [Acidobacteria bacterium]|nr:IS66 family transposase [Acidobacteriota bacterium]
MNVSLNLCEGCLEKQRTIDRLRQQIEDLRKKVRRLERKAEQGPFGSSTPSAKIPLKANTAPEQRSKPGGAQPGHVGHGRRTVADSEAGRSETIAVGPACPHCGSALEHKEYRDRSVIDSQPLRAEPILYQLERARCPRCGKTVQARAPAVLPKSLYGNQLITQVVFLHYRQGIPVGRLCSQLGVGLGAVFEILHRMAALFRGVVGKLIEEYRQAPVRHADETGWRTDGRSGYAWLFASATVSLFLFRPTRSAQVRQEVLGASALGGVLVVDRYHAYNRSPCQLQYCYAHLLRDVEELAQEFPGEAEVTAFTSTLIPLLAEAMHLRGRPLADADYYQQAQSLKQQIVDLVEQPAQHLGVRQIQGIFCDHAHRLYHWVDNRAVPADNNRAERELRPTVIARKVSFGSQSDAGAKTREVLMSLVHTLAKRTADPEAHFKAVLDQLAADPSQDPIALLFDTS